MHSSDHDQLEANVSMSNWRSTTWPARDQSVNILDKCWAAQVLISLLLFSAVFSKGVANANVDPVSHRFWEHLEENFLCGLSSVQCVHPTGTANVHSGAKNWHCQLQLHPQNQGEHCVGGNSVSLTGECSLDMMIPFQISLALNAIVLCRLEVDLQSCITGSLLVSPDVSSPGWRWAWVEM